jgi:hypothetical protein
VGCGVTSVPRHVLVDGLPMLLCAGCQRTLAEGELAERAR